MRQFENVQRKKSKMANMREVITGLKEGKAYVRYFGDQYRGGQETVKPLGEGRFEHIYAGHDHGGAAELSIDVLENGRWDLDGWQEI